MRFSLTLEAEVGVVQLEIRPAGIPVQLGSSAFRIVLVHDQPDGLFHGGAQFGHNLNRPRASFHRHIDYNFRILIVSLCRKISFHPISSDYIYLLLRRPKPC
ncbi:hypothetical protein SAY86_029597 [Trapa natans]|uniref:Uncharacterized protein n=1 Tax=Trapa natans TaxID=22666 RepID=A0AAN7MLM9_TRANT|nr:hypothetical protein SAY86_029597 [Trapa natans]